MKKTWLLFALLLAIGILISLSSSFYSVHAGGRVYPETASAVVISNQRYLIVRASFYILPYPDSTMTLSFSNESQTTVSTMYHFEVLLPKTEYPTLPLPFGPEETFVSNEHPLDAQVISNITSDVISDINGTYSGVSNYWFTVQGNGSVTCSAYGVAV